MYLYRAVDSKGNTIDFFLNKTRDQKAARHLFKKALRSCFKATCDNSR
ncbi:DDE-type integrase/transposase/recombinase [Bacillus mycoides]|nr:DDE-type integrase/transposase/recombinase [Bacillus mycoides]